MHPLADPLGDLLELRIAGLAAAAALRVVEQRLVELPALLDVFEEARLFQDVGVDGNDAPLLGLFERRLDHHAPDSMAMFRDVVGMEAG
ncbi:hypothetical protein ACVWW4_006917 [Bradyrhizobium sp. LB7.1]